MKFEYFEKELKIEQKETFFPYKSHVTLGLKDYLYNGYFSFSSRMAPNKLLQFFKIGRALKIDQFSYVSLECLEHWFKFFKYTKEIIAVYKTISIGEKDNLPNCKFVKRRKEFINNYLISAKDFDLHLEYIYDFSISYNLVFIKIIVKRNYQKNNH